MNEPVVKYLILEQRMGVRLGDVADEHRLARLRDAAGHALPHGDAQSLHHAGRDAASRPRCRGSLPPACGA